MAKEETPEARFRRLASARVDKALKAIKLIGNLTGTQYKSTSEQREKIDKALSEAVKGVKESLAGTKAAKAEFNL